MKFEKKCSHDACFRACRNGMIDHCLSQALGWALVLYVVWL